MSSHPAIIAMRWIYGQLAPGGTLDAALGVAGVVGAYPDTVPASVAWSGYFALFGEQSPGVDLQVIGQRRLVTDPLIRCTVVGRVPNLDALDAAAQRLDALLHGLSGAVTGGAVDSCTRERPLRLGPMEGPGAVTIYQLGGLYRLTVREI